jgi:hypothetical protein
MKAANIKREGGKIVYRGHEFPGFNKPVDAPKGASQKKMVLAKKGDEVKLVRFGLRGMEDFTQHHDAERRKNYLARSAGIKDKNGKPTKDDVFSANHWARKVLW